MWSKCPICDSSHTQTVLTLEAMPLFSNVLHETRQEALETQRAPMRLDGCAGCGFIYNAIFEPQSMQYGRGYENDLSASPHFCRYATDLAAELVQRYNLHDRDIIEIGCGNGHFLRLICDLGQNRGLGFDPSYDVQREGPDRRQSQVEIVNDFYSSRYGGHPADMICCRHVLEHIHDPLAFLRELRGTLGPREDCILFFEVPNAGLTFLRGGVWDVLYEHCNYFTQASLRALFTAAKFVPLQIDQRYDDQFLTIEARPAARAIGRGDAVAADGMNAPDQLAGFQGLFREIVDSWQMRIAAWEAQRRKVVAWGAGAKGTTFLNVLGLFPDTLEYMVDIHPRKQGRFVSGTGQEIIPPRSLARCQAETVIVMNPAYLLEIREMAGEYATDLTFVAASAPHALSS